MTVQNRTKLIVIQPTPFCNLDCTYCYLPDRSNTAKLFNERLHQIINFLFQLRNLGDKVTVVWHAGEPLVMGPSFFETAFNLMEAQRPSGVTIDHAIQTNGTLINSRFCRIFRDFNVNVGVSIDGPEAIHDKARKYRSGMGSFRNTMRGIQCLQENEISFYTLTVLTSASIHQADLLFDFFNENDLLRLAFNIEEEESVNERSTLRDIDVVEAYKTFLRTFWVRAAQSSRPFTIREIERALFSIKRATRGPFVNDQVIPFAILSIDMAGRVSTFSPELLGVKHERYGDFLFGNCEHFDLEAMTRSEKFQRVRQHIDAGVERCRQDCEFFGVCGGGAPVNKLFENGSFDSTETLYCKLNYQAAIEVALEFVESFNRARSSNDAAMPA